MWEFMVDLETMSTAPNGAIISIGCVAFDVEKSILHHKEFHTGVGLQSCLDAGLVIDASTVMWWLQQDVAAQRELVELEKRTLRDALLRLADYILEIEPDIESVKVWGNGASFDNVLLTSAYKAAGLKKPWMFWNDRCYRTMKAMLPAVDVPFEGTAHNALADAKYQATYLITALQHFK